MAAKKMIYVSDGNMEEVWERAEKLKSPWSMSGLICHLLAKYVAEKEETIPDASSITVDVLDQESGTIKTKRFNGKWLLGEEGLASESENVNVGVYWHAVQTEKKSLVVLTGDRFGEFDSFTLYNHLNHMNDGVPEDIKSAIANAVGETYVEELDI